MSSITTRQLRSSKNQVQRKGSNDNKFLSKIKRRKWDDDYIVCFFLPRSEESSNEASVHCMFCYFEYTNRILAHSKLRSHLQNKYGIHQKKSLHFFEKKHEYL